MPLPFLLIPAAASSVSAAAAASWNYYFGHDCTSKTEELLELARSLSHVDKRVIAVDDELVAEAVQLLADTWVTEPTMQWVMGHTGGEAADAETTKYLAERMVRRCRMNGYCFGLQDSGKLAAVALVRARKSETHVPAHSPLRSIPSPALSPCRSFTLLATPSPLSRPGLHHGEELHRPARLRLLRRAREEAARRGRAGARPVSAADALRHAQGRRHAASGERHQSLEGRPALVGTGGGARGN
jgi:hypothetical protein